MKTYLQIMFNSEGAAPSEVKNQLLNMGFMTTKGNYDFVYDWGDVDADLDQIVFFADKVYTALKHSRVFFNIQTI
ncbi:MAG: hypothetical protein KKC68_05950 [Candidatus Thermoplasmatota archaeon]|nr:hypothetical protein [Candidatus Thermoplasmatota archaeon]MBU1941299.1 hypothetical protein [Candidatus Thermoplasmatota archaeon]